MAIDSLNVSLLTQNSKVAQKQKLKEMQIQNYQMTSIRKRNFNNTKDAHKEFFNLNKKEDYLEDGNFADEFTKFKISLKGYDTQHINPSMKSLIRHMVIGF